MPLTTGTRIGPYEVTSSIGAGGMGEVYKARDTKLGRDVALKVLPQAVAMLPDRLARFRREAQLLAALNHPNIAQVYGLEEAADGTLALVMELVDGVTLAEVISDSDLTQNDSASSRLSGRDSAGARAGAPPSAGSKTLDLGERRRRLRTGSPPQKLEIDDALRIAAQIVDGMEAAHAQGIIHRDLKPANIILKGAWGPTPTRSPDGSRSPTLATADIAGCTVKVLDFGLAKALAPVTGGDAAGGPGTHELANSPTITSPAMTELGMILGTAAYMAPEQAKGRAVDKRADIWAFGCVLYEMLTRRRAFAGDDVSDTLANILKSEPDWSALPAETPPAVRRLIRRCLAKSVSERLPDIGVARLEIAEARTHTVNDDRPWSSQTAAPSRETRERPRRPVWLLAALGAAIIALAATAPIVWSHLREVRQTAPAIRFATSPPPGRTFHPESAMASLSPDGRFLVFRAQGLNEASHLWVRALDTMEPRQLPGTARAGRAIWSPDSRAIAFWMDGFLRRMDIAGGPVHTITELKSAPGGSWNQDGTIIVGDVGGGVVRVPAAGGRTSPVTTLDTSRKETGHVFPQFLPGGRQFIFTTLPDNVVMLGSLDEPGHRELLRVNTSAQYAPPGYLLYVTQGTLMAQPFDAGAGTVRGEPVPIAEDVRMVNTYGLFSTSDTDVLTIEHNEGSIGGQPVWVDRGGRTSPAGAAGMDDALFPRLSPDGRRMALSRSRDIWVADLGGLPPIRLTFAGKERAHFSPFWSPDGRQLIYEGQQLTRLQMLPSDGSSTAPTAVGAEGHFHPHAWLPGDSQALLATRIGPNMDIISMPLDGKGAVSEVVATSNREGAEGVSLSPDGRWMAYAANPTGQIEIWVRPHPGPGAPVRVSPKGGIEPAWSRNGRELFYIDVQARQLMAVATQAATEFRFSPPAALFSTAAFVIAQQPPSYDVASDGRFLMIDAASREPVGSRPLTVVVNWADGIASGAK